MHDVGRDSVPADHEPVGTLHLATGRSRAASPGSFSVRRVWTQAALRLAVTVAVAVAVAVTAGTASGHGGSGPALVTIPSEARAGDMVEVFGEDLQPLGAVNVVMLTADGSLSVLDAETDREGHFTESFVVPDLPERIYELVATDAAGGTASTYLLVAAPDAAAAELWLTSPSGLLAIAGVAVLVVGALAVAVRAPRQARRTGRRG